MRAPLHLIVLVPIAALLVACLPQMPVTVEPAGPTPTPVECTENPAGLSIDVWHTGGHGVAVAGGGFRPGESLVLIFTAQQETADGSQGYRLESRPVAVVSADGTFSFDETLPEVGGGTPWHLQVVHSRGTACAVFPAGG